METPSDIKPILKKMVKSYLWNALIWTKNVMALKIAMMDQMRKIVRWLVMKWLNFNVSMKTIQFYHWSVFQKSNVAMASMIVPRVKMRMIVQQPVTKTTNLRVVRLARPIAQPKPGFCIGNRNQGPISVSVSEPKLFSKTKLFFSKILKFSHVFLLIRGYKFLKAWN